jgi:hypothetical protein
LPKVKGYLWCDLRKLRLQGEFLGLSAYGIALDVARLTPNWLGAAIGRNQIRSTKSEIRNKSESPKLKIQNRP